MNLLDRLAYDTGGYTVQEILSSFCNKILEIIDLVNKNEEVCDEAHTLIENIRNEVVPDLVDDIMKELQDTGYFNNLVNVTLIEQLRSELTTLLNDTITEYTSRLDNFNSKLDTIKNIIEVDVRDFGAKGDGVTDDTDAINNAIKYVYENYKKLTIQGDWQISSGVVNLKSGVFKCDGTIYLLEGVTLQGSTTDSTIILSATNNTYAITNRYQSEVNGYRNVNIKNLSVKGNSIYLLKAWNCSLENVSVYNSASHGLLIQLSVFCRVRNFRAYQCGTGLEMNGNAGDGPCTSLYAENIWLSHCTNGIKLIGGSNWIDTTTINNLIVEYCSNIGYIYGGADDNHGVKLTNCHFEQNISYLTVGYTSLIIDNVYCDDTTNFNIVFINDSSKTWTPNIELKNIIGKIYFQPNVKGNVKYENVFSINENGTCIIKSSDRKKYYETTSGTEVIKNAYKYFNFNTMFAGEKCLFDVMITCDEGYFVGKCYLDLNNAINLFEYGKSGITLSKNINGTIVVNESVTNLKYKISQVI